MEILSLQTETGALYKSTTMMSIHMTSLQEWIKNIRIIIVTTQSIKADPRTNKTAQPMKMALSPAPTQPTKTVRNCRNISGHT